jgi:hypothetical protein
MNVNNKPEDFRVGEVYQVFPTEVSHEKKPYFVQIDRVNTSSGYIETRIPYKGSKHISWFSTSWGYMMERMFYVGIGEKAEKYLYGQKLKLL